jgi:TPP-dependent pyruvate/acetoin dehydrogenase alpha subunit
MAECVQRLQQYLQQQEDRSQGASLPEEKRGKTPRFDLRAELFRMTGTDLTQIDGIDVTATMTILRTAHEQGEDRTPFCLLATALPRIKNRFHIWETMS